MMRVLLIALTAVTLAWPAEAQKPITLTAKDGLNVNADVYEAANAKATTWIVLAHQAQASRGEYRTIAPRLNALGYHAIALDQRSGGSFGGVTNRTALIAKKKGKKSDARHFGGHRLGARARPWPGDPVGQFVFGGAGVVAGRRTAEAGRRGRRQCTG